MTDTADTTTPRPRFVKTLADKDGRLICLDCAAAAHNTFFVTESLRLAVETGACGTCHKFFGSTMDLTVGRAS